MDRIDEAVVFLTEGLDYETLIKSTLKKHGGEIRVDVPEFADLLSGDEFWRVLFDMKKRGVIEAEFPDKMPEASVIRLAKQ